MTERHSIEVELVTERHVSLYTFHRGRAGDRDTRHFILSIEVELVTETRVTLYFP